MRHPTQPQFTEQGRPNFGVKLAAGRLPRPGLKPLGSAVVGRRHAGRHALAPPFGGAITAAVAPLRRMHAGPRCSLHQGTLGGRITVARRHAFHEAPCSCTIIKRACVRQLPLLAACTLHHVRRAQQASEPSHACRHVATLSDGPESSTVMSSMKVTTSALEMRMATLPTTALEVIVSDARGQYTAEARAVAATALARRTSGSQDSADEPDSGKEPKISYAVEDMIAAPLYAFRQGRATLRAWQKSLLPPRTPERIRALFWLGLAAALPGLASASASLIQISLGVRPAVDDFWSFSNMPTFVLALTGLLLSYGIFTEKIYPRRLAVVFAIAWAFLPLRRHERSENECSWQIAVPIRWTYETIRYLLLSSEVNEYYALLRSEQSQHTAIAASTGLVTQRTSGIV